MLMQPGEEVGDRGAKPWVGRVGGSTVDRLVEPQAASTGVPGQRDEEAPVAARHAGGQPDPGSLQVRRERHFPAYRLLVRLGEKVLERVTIRTEIQAADPSRRAARKFRDGGTRGGCEREGGAYERKG